MKSLKSFICSHQTFHILIATSSNFLNCLSEHNLIVFKRILDFAVSTMTQIIKDLVWVFDQDATNGDSTGVFDKAPTYRDLVWFFDQDATNGDLTGVLKRTQLIGILHGFSTRTQPIGI